MSFFVRATLVVALRRQGPVVSAIPRSDIGRLILRAAAVGQPPPDDARNSVRSASVEQGLGSLGRCANSGGMLTSAP